MIKIRGAADVENAILTRYRRRTPHSQAQHGLAQRVLPGGDTRISTHYAPYPTYMATGEGAWLSDCDGNRYLDFLNNYTSLVHGHAPPAIVEEAADQLTHGTVFGSAAKPQVEFAQMLIERVASVEMLRFTNSGTEATMMMMRAARAFTGRDVIVKIDGGYHGAQDLAKVNVSAQMDRDKQLQARVEGPGVPSAVLDTVMVAPFNDLNAMATLLAEHHRRIAAIIVEPMANSGGMIPPLPEYLPGLRELADEYEVLLLFDEVVTLRLSSGGMQEIYGVQPDMTAMAKVIGGGFPIGAFGGKRALMEQFNPDRAGDVIQHSGTFNGNNITMVAGMAAMQRLDQAAIDRINRLGDQLQAGINSIFESAGIRARCHGYGSLQQIQWTDEDLITLGDVRRASQDLGKLPLLFHLELLNRGIHCSPRTMFNICTPTQAAEIDRALAAIEATVDTLKPYVSETLPRLLLDQAAMRRDSSA